MCGFISDGKIIPHRARNYKWVYVNCSSVLRHVLEILGHGLVRYAFVLLIEGSNVCVRRLESVYNSASSENYTEVIHTLCEDYIKRR